MPTITPTPIPALGVIQVDLDMTDTALPTLQYAKVERVRTDTGEVQALRPHTSINEALGQYIQLSNGRARFHDNEAPLDVPVYYIVTDAEPDAIPVQGAVVDTFTRVAANTWSAADSGQTYTLTGTAADFDITGNVGTIALTAVNSERVATMAAVSLADVDMEMRWSVDKLAVTQPINVYMRARVNGTTYYQIRVAINTSNQIQLQWERVVAGVVTALGTLTTQQDDLLGAALPFIAGGSYYLHARIVGSHLQAKVWESGFFNEGWTVDVYDSTITAAGGVAIRGLLTTGNTTALPVTASIGEFGVGNANITTASSTVTLLSNGTFWLRNPMQPCLDLNVVLCTDPACPPTAGIIFASMDAEQYNANSDTVAPINRVLPISVSRPRRKVDSTLNLVTRTFDDRDALLATLADGRPLLWSAPAVWRMPDRYMDIATVGVARGMDDHRIEPRLFGLPYVQCEPPVGPAKGGCTVQYDAFCDDAALDTWAEADTANLTYNDMIDLVP